MDEKNIKEIADILDTKFKGPFGTRFGLDGLIGLIPGIGDIITTGLSLIIVIYALFMEIKFSVILRMLLNILIDNLVAKVPFLGVLFDFAFKSNQKNIRLISQYKNAPNFTAKTSTFYISSVVILCLVFFFGLAYLSFLLIERIITAYH